MVQTYFTEHPIYDRDGAPIVVPEGTFPGRGRVQSRGRMRGHGQGRAPSGHAAYASGQVTSRSGRCPVSRNVVTARSPHALHVPR